MNLHHQHFRIVVSTGHRADGSRIGMWCRHFRSRDAIETALSRFGAATWIKGTGGWFDLTIPACRVGPNLIFDIGIRRTYGRDSAHKLALNFCEYLRILFEQDCVYLMLPSGQDFLHKG